MPINTLDYRQTGTLMRSLASAALIVESINQSFDVPLRGLRVPVDLDTPNSLMILLQRAYGAAASGHAVTDDLLETLCTPR